MGGEDSFNWGDAPDPHIDDSRYLDPGLREHLGKNIQEWKAKENSREGVVRSIKGQIDNFWFLVSVENMTKNEAKEKEQQLRDQHSITDEEIPPVDR